MDFRRLNLRNRIRFKVENSKGRSCVRVAPSLTAPTGLKHGHDDLVPHRNTLASGLYGSRGLNIAVYKIAKTDQMSLRAKQLDLATFIWPHKAVKSYNHILQDALDLSPEQQWALIAALVSAAGCQPRRSIAEFFAVIGPSAEDAQHRVEQLRSEWNLR